MSFIKNQHEIDGKNDDDDGVCFQEAKHAEVFMDEEKEQADRSQQKFHNQCKRGIDFQECAHQEIPLSTPELDDLQRENSIERTQYKDETHEDEQMDLIPVDIVVIELIGTAGFPAAACEGVAAYGHCRFNPAVCKGAPFIRHGSKKGIRRGLL